MADDDKLRQRRTRPSEPPSSSNDATQEQPAKASKSKVADAAALFSDFAVILMLVFGGCCSNVWSFERLLRSSPHVGSIITFSQTLFITCQTLPQFVTWQATRIFNTTIQLPQLLPRHVPLRRWALQVLVLATGSLLNNWAFAYDVPLTLQIIFRSSGLPISMLFGYIFQKRRYSILQLTAVVLVTSGVVLATLSRPSSSTHGHHDPKQYHIGISMLSASLLLTGALGVMQERTYGEYGPHWREGVFYTHFLSLPLFTFLIKDIQRGYSLIAEQSSTSLGLHSAYFVLMVNLVTQLICVSGVNRLTSKVNSVSTNLVLTVRKAISLCLSVWLFQNEWNSKMVLGATMVFTGSLLYTMVTSKR